MYSIIICIICQINFPFVQENMKALGKIDYLKLNNGSAKQITS